MVEIQNKKISILGLLIALFGFLYAGVIATGFQIPRLALMVPLLVLGAFLCVTFGPKRNDIAIVAIISLVAGYLLFRGAFSPVWDLARIDLFLISAGLLAFLTASSSLQCQAGRRLFLGFFVLLVIINSLVAFYQWQVDEKFAFLSAERVDVLGVSGFYYHRNYLAGFLEIACPLVLAAGLAQRALATKLLLFSTFGLGVFVCFLTNSRGGFAVAAVASVIVVLLEIGKKEKASKRQFWRFSLLSVVVLAVVLGGVFLWEQILDNRGGEGSVAGAKSGRLGLAGIAFEIWTESPVIGMGSHSFSYLFPKFFYGLGGWYGNARMAHSDYLQLLTDYGVIGFLAVAFLLLVIGFLLLKKREDDSDMKGESFLNGLWLRSAALAVLVAECVRAAFDFNLHIAPNLIAFAMVIAGGVVCSRPTNYQESDGLKQMSFSLRWSKSLACLVVLFVGGYSLYAGKNEILAVGDFIELENAKETGRGLRKERREYSEQAPSFETLRLVAKDSLRSAIAGEDDFGLAKEDWSRVVNRHPLDAEALTSYARTLDELSFFEKAEGYHLRALEAAARRENKYGVVFGVGWHLYRRGEEAHLSRRSGEALFLFREAEVAFAESHRRNFSRKGWTGPALKSIRQRIAFLEGARIQSQPVPVIEWRAALK